MKLADLAKQLNISTESLKKFIEDFDLDLGECLHTNFELKPDFEKFALENADFLKKEYGTGGGTYAGGVSDYNYDCDAKGVRIRKGYEENAPEIRMNWTEVAKEIGADALVYQDLDDLKLAVSEINPNIDRFDASCFDGDYVTNDVDLSA